jgi:hypothetical protein
MSELRMRLPRNGRIRLDVGFAGTVAPTRLRVFDLDKPAEPVHETSNAKPGKNPWFSPLNTEDRYKVYVVKTEFQPEVGTGEWRPHNIQLLEIGTNRSITMGADDTEHPDHDYNDCVYNLSIIEGGERAAE